MSRPALLLVTLALLLPTFINRAASAQGYGPGNAAPHYQRAFDRHGQLSAEDRALIDSYQTDPQAEPPDGLRALLARQALTVADFDRGSRQPYLDWHLDYAQGFSLVLPHLAVARGISRTVSAQALLAMHDGRAVDAAEAIAMLYRVSAHYGADRILISSMVARAIHARADELLDIGLDHGVLDAHALGTIRTAHRGLEAGDPFLFGESIAVEHELATFTITSVLDATEQDAAEALEWIAPSPEVRQRISTLDEIDAETAMAQFDEAMTETARVFGLEDSDEALARLESLGEQISDGEFGPFCMMVMPAFDRAYRMMIEADALIAARAEQLQRLTTGGDDVAKHINAAVFYLRAAQRIQSMPAESLAALREEDETGEFSPIVDDLDPRIGSESLALMTEGTMRPRCDFGYLRNRHHRFQLCPEYVADLRDLVRAAHARLRRDIAASDSAAVEGGLERLYRFVAHLSGQTAFANAMLAHDTLVRTSELAAAADRAGLLAPAAHTRIGRTVNTIPRVDPFGYLAAQARLRRDVIDGLAQYEHQRAQRPALEAWPIDRHVFVVAAMNTLAPRPDGEPGALLISERRRVDVADPDRLARAGGLFENDQLDAVTPIAVDVIDGLRVPDPTVLDGRVLPMPAQLELRTQRARADLRAAVRQHRVDAPPPED